MEQTLFDAPEFLAEQEAARKTFLRLIESLPRSEDDDVRAPKLTIEEVGAMMTMCLDYAEQAGRKRLDEFEIAAFKKWGRYFHSPAVMRSAESITPMQAKYFHELEASFRELLHADPIFAEYDDDDSEALLEARTYKNVLGIDGKPIKVPFNRARVKGILGKPIHSPLATLMTDALEDAIAIARELAALGQLDREAVGPLVRQLGDMLALKQQEVDSESQG